MTIFTALPLDVPKGKVAAIQVPLTVNQPRLKPMA
jgi:hypothetical protein